MLEKIKFYIDNWKNLFDLKKYLLTFLYHIYFFRITNRKFKGIHLGSGDIKIDDFLNIDANIFFSSDLVANIKKIKVNDDAVDCIYNSHILEHVKRVNVDKILIEWKRVLKPGGIIYICVPDLEKLFEIYLSNLKHYDKSKDSLDLVDFATRVIYGGQNHKYNFHYNGFSFPTIKKKLEALGFRSIERTDGNVFNLKDGSTARIGENISISLNIKAIK